MRRRNVGIAVGIVVVIGFAFSVPLIPMWVVVHTGCQIGMPCAGPIIQVWGYGSATYYLFGLGATYQAGTYGFTAGK